MHKDENEPTYAVGYKKPPQNRRFRQGVSGNARGRPRGCLNVATVLERILHEPIVITEGNVSKIVPRFEAVLKALANKAAGGDIVAIRQLLALAVSAGLDGASVEPKAQLSDSDLKLMNRVLERLQKPGKEKRDDHHE
jgi:hypothetical protein